MPKMTSKRKLRRFRTALALASCVVFAAAFGAAELYLRRERHPSPDFARFLFRAELNRSRWDKLDADAAVARVEVGPEDLQPHRDYLAEPEEDRPPFDQVPTTVHIRTNALGFRDDEFTRAKRPGVKRIVVLGDSVSWGRGVSVGQRYPDLLEKSLGPGAEVYDMAIKGCTSRCMATMFEKFKDEAPDLLVIQASSNDVDLMKWRNTRRGLGPRLARAVNSLASRSRLILQLAFWAAGGQSSQGWLQAQRDAEQEYMKDLESVFSACESRHVPVVLLELPLADGRFFAPYVEKRCHAHPVACRLEVVADFEHADRWLAADSRQGANAPEDFVVRTARNIGLEDGALNSLFPYRRYFYDIVHPNELGHRLVARQLESALRRSRLIPLARL